MRKIGISAQALVAAAFGAVIMGGAISVPKLIAPEAGAQPIAIQAPPGAPLSFADLIEKVEPAVVSVNVIATQEVGSVPGIEEFFEQFRGAPGMEEFFQQRPAPQETPRQRESRSLGSGFFISEDGLVVTNHHVIDRATQIQIVTSDGKELEAELVGTDRQTDLAVVRVKEKGKYPHVEFGSSENVRKGDWVVALGNPFGLGGTATAGILSANGRELGAGSPYTDFIQIDAPINRGNSGGPTFDLRGNVIGVNSQILSPTGGSVGIGFAIPSELAKEVTDTLIKDGRVSRGWLGVQIADLTPEFAEALGIADTKGSLIADVTVGSPAEKAGLRRNDIILSVNGQKVTDATSTTRIVGRLIANTANKFDIIREGKRQTINVTVGERPEDPYATPGNPGSPDAGPGDQSSGVPGALLDDLGVRLVPMTEEIRERLALRPGDTGLAITEVTPDSVFAKAGFESGLVILESNGQPVPSVAAFEKTVSEARAANRSKILLAVRVGQTTIYRTVDLPAG
ncbi:protease, Do family [Hyphomonas neptunium ATCC 15444]|uniref:Protease, Do family n=2 Tax=Hyphomonas TaxID=85 RepID=Q0C2L2_HYPNA|nr:MULTISPECIES: Do family serine endopeptidase [Hyphomonas]ABI77029.1 protease, Do family [Hyphomonas neptunium ATCC 15444]KCZ95734.1 Do family protease [Hyphomonas hirschiana VP5]